MDQREFLRQMEELVDFGRTKENLSTHTLKNIGLR